MLYPKIIEVSTDKDTGHTYVLVHFWRGKAARTRGNAPYLIEDFLMQLRPTGTRLLDEGNPHLGSEPYDRDMPAEIDANITAYIVQAEKYDFHGDNSSRTASAGEFYAKGKRVRPKATPIKAVKRDQSDPSGALTPEVKALEGKNVDVAAVSP